MACRAYSGCCGTYFSVHFKAQHKPTSFASSFYIATDQALSPGQTNASWQTRCPSRLRLGWAPRPRGHH
eukprot:6209867-Pleurochrysis_carterae.AAC.1